MSYVTAFFLIVSVTHGPSITASGIGTEASCRDLARQIQIFKGDSYNEKHFQCMPYLMRR
jgi:hypothetical protein